MIAARQAETRIVSELRRQHSLGEVQLDQARREARFSGLPLVEILLVRDMISDEDVARIYAEQNGLRYLDLSRRSISDAWALTIPENVARRKLLLPLGEVNGELIVAMGDPADRTALNIVQRRYDRPVHLVVSPRYQIRQCQERVYPQARQRGVQVVDVAPPRADTVEVGPAGLNIVEAIDSIIDEAVDRRASDIHIEPEEDRLRVRMRIDGRMIEARSLPLEVASALVSRVKVLATLDITERRAPQDGRFQHTSFDTPIDIRVATIPTILGERITLRLLGIDRARLGMSELGMDAESQQSFERLIRRPYGIILLTGPTGSGKTTTMYAALQTINTIDKHIITIENPVEYHITGVNQIQVDSQNNITFASALRSIVRHDPDIIMVGEIRDHETAHLALESSLTGHLVFATLHTNSAAGAITRLLDMGCEPFLVASGVIGVIAQRLVRRICENCKTDYTASVSERSLLDVPAERAEVKLYRGRGCARCLRSGYYDRVGIYELMRMDSGLADLVMQKAPTEAIHRYAVDHGTRTLRMDALAKALAGVTTAEEAVRVTTADVL
jgi:type IV pilus assembly protein PilB